MVKVIEIGGVVKLGNFSGQERRRRLEEQALKCGTTPEELRQQKKNKMANWQAERDHLRLVRCPNCGHRGHNFDWCPFALPFFLRQLGRFRGNCGLWMREEPPLALTDSERIKFNKHFAILSMRLLPAQSAHSKVASAHAS
jgi:DNA-directed RNA polymerase subunit RPC12/RpoP